MDFRNLVVDEPLEKPAAQVSSYSSSDFQTWTNDIKSKASRGDAVGAIMQAVNAPPYGISEPVKSAFLSAVSAAIVSVKSSEIPSVIKSMDVNQRDVLLKYLYWSMAHPPTATPSAGRYGAVPTSASGGTTTGIILSYFEKLMTVAGEGDISRVLSDRRQFS
ncbi:hypothetical protein CANCADRAFT_3928 [Tortispora caseinolytica NRRL Y-17796]|uniref:Actin-related protein 2/3 complex subunit 5 n=1 Tax=Tortispora caseinolytica NRRL Y-17796 TaxID=767744 RepID=A0A1E4TC58_9ASCO|nr:hypothetical protein CANCADRAFT_3928 [Tortispora caseinolytica NRRL Y-17796]